MKMRGTAGLLALAFALPLPFLAGAQEGSGSAADRPDGGTRTAADYNPHSRPPKNLKKLPDGHWTPWDPPTPPPGASVHVVVPGDTLWDLSARYLKNPYLWPQIWDQNRYILDSHWIYPGDPIVLPSPEVVPQDGPIVEMEEGEEAPPQPTLPPPPPPRYPIGDEQDFYCAAYIRDDPAPEEPRIVATEEERIIGIGQGDVVYLNAGSRDGWKPGDRFSILRDGGEVEHPITLENVGHRVDMMGHLTLIAVQETTSTAEILFACQDVFKGDRLVPFRKMDIPTIDHRLSQKIDRYNAVPSGRTAGYLVLSKDPQEALAQGNLVAVDLGESNGLRPGDLLTVYRPNPSGDDLPRLNLGEAIVLITEPRSSVVRISASIREIYLGDRVEMR